MDSVLQHHDNVYLQQLLQQIMDKQLVEQLVHGGVMVLMDEPIQVVVMLIQLVHVHLLAEQIVWVIREPDIIHHGENGKSLLVRQIELGQHGILCN